MSLSDIQRLAGSVALGREAMRLEVDKLVRLFFPAGTDVRVNDRALVGGVTYQIMDANSAASYEVHRETLAVKV